jgi:pimeloyl-ACP methyl ester carboxylesterase
LVFLHGYLSSKEAFTAQIEYFSRFYRVTAFDFLGFGKSKPLTEPFSVSDYAAWTKEILALLQVQKPRVIAHSFGCRVVVKMAAQDSGVFDKILLTGPAGILLHRGLAYRLKVKSYRLVKKFAPAFAERNFGSQEYRSLSPIMKESYKKIVNEDLRKDAARIKTPTLIVEGEQDKTTPLAEAQVYLQSLQNGRLRGMQGGHFAFAEYPLAFNLIAEEFLYD